MLSDKANLFSDLQIPATTEESTSSWHIGNLSTGNLGVVQIGTGKAVHAFVQVQGTPMAGAATVTAALVVDSVETLDASPLTIHTFPVFAAASVIGTLRTFTMPQDIPALGATDQYYGIVYTVTGTNVGAFDAGFVHDLSVLKKHVGGYVV